ncbi:MmcQ/YjbR family DNA-binding protein [Uruburuella testudinis]|uniref:MmcQ/YjbR family DNA-binding protein n=1 Tax=Uruburuella testudinis TaxID=1282863 RepID=A0ABY4DW67_9NEIS|nr:MmcQ/YjbR family DNA-binding protein [Uruburuella testudinis]UOO80931.1 MmcQ/YjbR family DNA-binding protein [Uruburuella testudinis]
MNRDVLIRHMQEHYAAAPEYLWARWPDYAVFRHGGGRKWFAVLMNIPANKLGLPDSAPVDVLNLKAAPEMVGSLLQLPGIFPAWHMNKEHWVSLLLEGGPNDETIDNLIDDSYLLTRK